MSVVIGLVVCLVVTLLYIGQLISTVNFALAQRLGLQEKATRADPLFSRLEANAARWDLLSLWPVPLFGLLILFDHPWWPYLGLIAGGLLVDTGGREAAKFLGLQAQGVRVGAAGERRLSLAVYAILVAAGLILIGVGLAELA